MMAASRTLIMALAIAATMVVELAMAANYTVGDSGGWEIGPDYKAWASSKNFTIGDVIIFEYSANHNVLEVNEADYGSCSASSPIDTHTDGSTSITLSTSVKRFFICGVPGHCSAGMKVEIDTLAETPSTPPSPMATPPSPPPEVTPSSPPPTSSPTAPTSPPPASPPKAGTKPPAKSPMAPPPDSKASPPSPPTEPTPPSSAPTPEPPTPPFPFDKPLIPSAAPKPPPPPPSSAYKCSFRVHLSVGFTFVVIMLLAL